jgi:glycosyltransferase involved in cell wall biosynthesis
MFKPAATQCSGATISLSLTRSAQIELWILPNRLAHEQVIQEFIKASTYVLPSVDEPFPMTVLEAMALGVPTIVTEGIHIRDLLERSKAAMVVPANPESIAVGELEIFANPGVATQLSENGRRLIANELTIDRVITRLERIYQGVTAGVCTAHNHAVIG